MLSVIKSLHCQRMLAPQTFYIFNNLFNAQRKFCAISQARYDFKQRISKQAMFIRRLSITTSCCDREKNTVDYNEDSLDEEKAIFDRDFIEMKVEDYESLYKDDETGEIKSQIEETLNDYTYLKYNKMGRVPTHISVEDMSRMLSETKTAFQRERYIHFLFKREMVKRSVQRKKEQDRVARLGVRKVKTDEMKMKYGDVRSGLLAPSGEMIYGLWHNSLFPRISERRIRSGNSQSRLRQAAMFGRKLVFDFDFDDHMTPYTNRNVLEQIQEAYGINRFKYEEPFDFWFCNLRPESQTLKILQDKALNNLFTGSMITIKSDCFTNYFEKSRLVYLSPNATTKLTDINNDDIYIIGVYNDKGATKPLTYLKARDLGIRSMSLPLDNHIAWNVGSKSLCVNHVTGILLEVMKNGGDWHAALMHHLPPRKIKPLDLLVMEEENRANKRRLQKVKQKFSIRHDMDLS